MIKKIAAISAMLGLCLSSSAYAGYIDKAEFTSDLKIVIEGNVADSSGDAVTLLIYPNGADLSSLGSASDSSQLFSTVDYYRQLRISDDGSFGCEVLFDDKEKGYRDIKVTVNGESEVYEKAVYVVTQNDINSLINTLNSRTDADEAFCTYILENLPIIAEEESEYATNEAIRMQTSKNILAARDFMYDGEFKTTADIKAALNMALLTTLSDLAKEKAGIEVLIEKYKTLSTLDKASFMKYYDACKNEAIGVIYSAEDLNVKDFYNTLGEAVVLSMVENVSNHNEISGILKDVNDFLKLDLSVYEKLADKSSVNKGIMKETSSLADFKAAFESLVDDAYYNSNKRPSSSGGSSGGGSFGGGSSGVIGNVSVNNPESQPNAPREYFNDIADFEWAKKSINSLAQLGIVSGVGNGRFEPSRSVTREEFVKMIVEAFSQKDEEAVCDFADITEKDWCYTYVATAVAKGFVNGTDASSFGKGQEIKRQDAALILSRITGRKAATAAHFGDMDNISDYALDAVNLMAELGVINGNENGDFKPHNSLTRAECAKVICELMNRIGEVN